MGSTLSIVLAVVAVVVGFLILRSITDDSVSSTAPEGADVTNVTTSPVDSGVETTTATVATTTPPLVTEGATVIVANASGVSGSAGRMTESLEGVGFTMGDPTNSTGGPLEDSIVYYDPAITAAQDVADSVAIVMGGLSVEPLPTPVPVDGGSIGDAGVLVMLGTNQADKSVEELSGTASDTTSATTTIPEASGDSTETTDG